MTAGGKRGGHSSAAETAHGSTAGNSVTKHPCEIVAAMFVHLHLLARWRLTGKSGFEH
jgi:hypothetical protein